MLHVRSQVLRRLWAVQEAFDAIDDQKPQAGKEDDATVRRALSQCDFWRNCLAPSKLLLKVQCSCSYPSWIA